MSCNVSDSIIEVLKCLNKSSIEYIHFKSTEHLDRSFNGLTDFDLLVDKTDYYKFQKFLITHGFKKRHSTYDKVYPGMEDYLFYESDSGMVHHFHVHYELMFGKKYSKNFYLPDSNNWISGSNYHEKYPIKFISPEKEMVLLTFRILLKQTVLSVIKGFLRKQIKRTGWTFGRMLDEYQYLNIRTIDEKINHEIKKYNSFVQKILSEFYYRFNNNNISLNFLLKSKFNIRKGLESHIRYSSKENKIITKVRSDLRNCSTSYLGAGGKLISIVGCDGSGKSTLVSDLYNWLNYKLTVEKTYLGKVKSSSKKRFYSRLSRIFKFLGFHQYSKHLKDYSHIVDAEVRMKIINDSIQKGQQGIITITDRYPLKEFWKMESPMDGPKLSESSIYYDLERSIYRSIEDYPDILIILDVSVKESMRRKPEVHSGESNKVMLSKKVHAIKELPDMPNTLKIDTHQPYELVLKAAKEFVWENL